MTICFLLCLVCVHNHYLNFPVVLPLPVLISVTARFAIVKTFCLRYNPFVRLDLFLKTSRLVKRRTVAQEMCGAGRVLVNGKEAKPAKEIEPGDTLRLSYSTRIIGIEVLKVPASSKNVKSLPEEIYRVISDQKISREEI
jgi:ribosomal 50S subunit-recycling heat shock protein